MFRIRGLALSLLLAAAAGAQTVPAPTTVVKRAAHPAPIDSARALILRALDPFPPDTVEITRFVPFTITKTDTLVKIVTRTDTLVRTVTRTDTVVVTKVRVDTVRVVITAPPPTPPPVPPVVVTPVPNDSSFLVWRPKYDSLVVAWGQKQWTRTGTTWNADGSGGNYYDRCYAWSLLDPFRTDGRAWAMCDEWRNKYAIPNAWRLSQHWGLVDGQWAEWTMLRSGARTPDSLALADTIAAGIDALANALANQTFFNSAYMDRRNGENRILGRTYNFAVTAHRKALAIGDTVSVKKWRAAEDTLIARFAAWQQPDGSYPADGQVCGGQLNYMVGMSSGYLIHSLDVRPDLTPFVRGQVLKAADYVQTTQAHPDTNASHDYALNYASVPCMPNRNGLNVGNPSYAPDLNQMWTEPAWWLAATATDPQERARFKAWGDSLFVGGTKRAYWSGGKQYNEQIAFGLRAKALRLTLIGK